MIGSRRDLLIQTGWVGVGLLTLPATLHAEPSPPLTFTAYRNGSRFGTHRLTFANDGPRRIVDIEIAFDYKLAFIPLYRYRHRNREVWQDGRLISLDTETDDNGASYRVQARADGDGLLVDGSGGKLKLPADTASTSYWSEATIERGEWLDTQHGKLVRSKVTAGQQEPFTVGGKQVTAKPYQLEGDITCRLWYLEGRWVGLRFAASDDSVIEYAIESAGQTG